MSSRSWTAAREGRLLPCVRRLAGACSILPEHGRHASTRTCGVRSLLHFYRVQGCVATRKPRDISSEDPGSPQVYIEEVVLLSTVNLGASLLYKVPSASGTPQVTYDDVAQQMYAVGSASFLNSCQLNAVPTCGNQHSNSCALTPAVRAGLQCTIAIGIDGPCRQSHGTNAPSQRHIICRKCRNHNEYGNYVTST